MKKFAISVLLFIIFICNYNFAKVYDFNTQKTIKQIIVYRQDGVVEIKYNDYASLQNIVDYELGKVATISIIKDETKYIPCTCNKTRTPLGKYFTGYVSDKYDRWCTLNRDNEGKIHYGQYRVRFNGSILFHSALYNRINDPLSLDIPSYNGLADNDMESQGCVRLRIKDVKEIFDNAKYNSIEVIVTDNKTPVKKWDLTCEQSDFKKWEGDDEEGYDLTDMEAQKIFIENYNKENCKLEDYYIDHYLMEMNYNTWKNDFYQLQPSYPVKEKIYGN